MGILDLINKLTSAVEENVAPAVNEYVHDEEGRARACQFAASVAKKAAHFGFHAALNWVPGGPLMREIVKEGLKDQQNKNKKSKPTAMVEEMQAKMEKMQEDINTIEQLSKILMEKMQEQMNTVKQQEEMNTIKQQSKILMEKMQELVNTIKQMMDTMEKASIRSRL